MTQGSSTYLVKRMPLASNSDASLYDIASENPRVLFLNCFDICNAILDYMKDHLLTAFICWNITQSRELTFGNQQISKQIWSVHMTETREDTELWYFVSNLIKWSKIAS